MEPESGLLYIVATPIGNLDDITLRAIRILKGVDWIAAEDTRHTRKLLTHHGIQAKWLSYREQNHQVAAKRLLDLLNEGSCVALVSDAGMPGISDPGGKLVQTAVQDGIRVVPIPGPCAAVAALAAAGLATDRFLFKGFLPRKPGELKAALKELASEPGTLVFYESPKRVGKTLASMVEIFGPERKAVLARELTKLYETFHRATLGELADSYIQGAKGEVTLLVEGGEKNKIRLGGDMKVVIEALRRGQSLPPGEIARTIAGMTGLDRNTVYRMVMECSGEKLLGGQSNEC